MKYKIISLIIIFYMTTIMVSSGMCADAREVKNWSQDYAVMSLANWKTKTDGKFVYLTIPSIKIGRAYESLISIHSIKDISPNRLTSIAPDELRRIFNKSFDKLKPDYSQLGSLEQITFLEIKGKKAICGVFEGLQEGEWHKHKLYVILSDERVYITTYMAYKEFFDKHLNEAETIIKSLRVI